MALGKKTGGRKKGTPNKQTKEVKQNLIEAFEKLGGLDGMVDWASKNQGENLGEFYKLWVKVLPVEMKTDLTSSDGTLQPISIQVVGVDASTD